MQGRERWFFITAMATTLFSPLLYANPENIANRSYVYFGIGAQIQSYREDLSNNDISSDSQPNSLVQFSGVYTAVDSVSGYYITTSSPIQNIATTETWSHNTFGTLQTNRTELGISKLAFAKSRIISPGHQTMYGLNYTVLNFTRYDFAPGAGAQAYNNALIANNPSNPAYADGVAFEIPGCTNHSSPPLEGMSCDSLAIEEQLSSLSFTYSYKYDSFFKHNFAGPRFSFEAGLSIPIFYAITNTSQPGIMLVGSLGQGYGLHINTSTSVYANERFQVNLGAGVQLIHRNQVADTSIGLIYPNTDTLSTNLYTSISWTLD